MILLGYGGAMWTQQIVPSGVTSLILSVEPLWFFVMDWLFFRAVRPNLLEWIGLTLGFAGTFYLAFGQGAVSFEAIPGYRTGMIVVFMSSLGWVFGSLLSRRIRISRSPSLGIAMQMIAVGILMLALSLLFGEWGRFSAQMVSVRSWLALGYLITFGSLIAFSAFAWLLRVEPASRVATHGFVNPVVAVVLGWAFADEQLTAPMIAAAAVVVLSVVLITFSRRTGRREAASTTSRATRRKPVPRVSRAGRSGASRAVRYPGRGRGRCAGIRGRRTRSSRLTRSRIRRRVASSDILPGEVVRDDPFAANAEDGRGKRVRREGRARERFDVDREKRFLNTPGREGSREELDAAPSRGDSPGQKAQQFLFVVFVVGLRSRLFREQRLARTHLFLRHGVEAGIPLVKNFQKKRHLPDEDAPELRVVAADIPAVVDEIRELDGFRSRRRLRGMFPVDFLAYRAVAVPGAADLRM